VGSYMDALSHPVGAHDVGDVICAVRPPDMGDVIYALRPHDVAIPSTPRAP